MPKFRQIENHSVWSNEKTHEQILSVDADVANFNRRLNRLNGEIAVLNQKKKAIRIRISNKIKYKTQLINQLQDEH